MSATFRPSARYATLLLIAAVACCARPTICSAQDVTALPVVRRLDHILIASKEPEELFALLAEIFGFPVAWPMTNHGRFASGGVAVGNVNLEVLQSSSSDAIFAAAKFVGLALEPEPLRICIPQLNARGISHGSPQPFRPWKLFGTTKTLWTTVALPTVSSETVEVFLCEFGSNPAPRNQQLRKQLQARDGGPLGVNSVREIVYGVRDLRGMQEQWHTLLHPIPAASALWQMGTGPAIRLIAANHDELRELVVNVRSLEQARRFLKLQGLLRTEHPGAVTLGGALLQGVTITLVEQNSTES